MYKQITVVPLALLVAAGFANAAAITYTESVTASGSLGATPFTNSLVTLTVTDDTSDVTQPFEGVYWIQGVSISIDIASLGTTAIGTGAVYSQPVDGPDCLPEFDCLPDAGFALDSSEILLSTNSFALDGYEMTTAIGPITDRALSQGSSIALDTNDGSFDFSSTAEDSTFTAAFSPEPETMVLFGLGLAGLAAFKRRR